VNGRNLEIERRSAYPAKRRGRNSFYVLPFRLAASACVDGLMLSDSESIRTAGITGYTCL